MRITVLLLATSVLASAATNISDFIINPFGGYFNGTLQVSCPAAFDPGGNAIAAMDRTFTITNGLFEASIHPYDTATPRYTCTAKYSTTNPQGRPVSWQQQWMVYTTTSTIRIVDLVHAVSTPTASGSVLDVFGRTGHVIALPGDYSADMVRNAVDLTSGTAYLAGAKQRFAPSSAFAGAFIQCAALPSIPATGDLVCDSGDSNKLKIYNGSAWVAGTGGGGGSGITQLTGDCAAGPGTGSQSITCAKINGTTVPVNSAADQLLSTTGSAVATWATIPLCVDSGGQHLNYNTSTHVFSCGTSGGGGGGGATQTSELTDFPLTRTSATVLTFGANCGPTTRCNTSIGGSIYPIVGGPYTITKTGAHIGRICTYISNTGTLSVAVGGASLVLGDITASMGLTAVSLSGGNCPTDSLQLARWDTDGSGNWNSTGDLFASAYSYKPSPIAGHGVQITPGPRDTFSVNTTNGVCNGSPGNTSGSYGDFCTDGSAVVYVCKNVSVCAVSGDWAVVGGSGSGGLAAPVTFTANASPQTYTVPAGINRVRVQVWAPGGAGQGTQAGAAAGVGGGSGGYGEEWCNVTPGGTVTVTVPLGAAGGAAGSAAPDASDASFGTCLVVKGGRWSTDHSLPGYRSDLGTDSAWYGRKNPGDASSYEAIPYDRATTTNLGVGHTYQSFRPDVGSPGGRTSDPGTSHVGVVGSPGVWVGGGGGSGAMDYGGAVTAGGTGGTSAKAGAGGNGGGTNNGSLTACSAGATPGGGGGGAAQDNTHTASGCSGGNALVMVWQ